MKRKTIELIVTVYVISVLVFSSICNAYSLSDVGESPISGAYVDKVVYQYVSNPDARVASLLAENVDAIFDPVDPANLGLLDADPDTRIRNPKE